MSDDAMDQIRISKPYPSIYKMNTPEDVELANAVPEKQEGQSKEALGAMDVWYENALPTTDAASTAGIVTP
eukprot:10164306-Lingulodinium_polyedra.AAC.1